MVFIFGVQLQKAITNTENMTLAIRDLNEFQIIIMQHLSVYHYSMVMNITLH